jgi:hypothetical protein
MARSGGVTFSAVVVLIGSSLTILFGALMALAILWTPNAGQAANLPIPIGYVVTAEAIVFFGFGGWGIASGVGLIKLRQWSRVSMMIYGAILLFFSVIPGIVLSFIPLPAATDPSVPPSFMTTFRVIMVGFYALLAALAGFWLYFFNKKSVKAQFVAEPSPTDGPTVRLALRRPGLRPLSITIIGWFFLVSAVLTPFGLLFAKTMFSGQELPFCFLGVFVSGWNAALIVCSWAVFQMIAAVGLLKLKKWGWMTAIGLQILGIVNGVLILGIPANRMKFEQMMERANISMGARMHQSVPLVLPTWVGIISSLPIVVAILWFLIAQKQVFNTPHNPSP